MKLSITSINQKQMEGMSLGRAVVLISAWAQRLVESIHWFNTNEHEQVGGGAASESVKLQYYLQFQLRGCVPDKAWVPE